VSPTRIRVATWNVHGLRAGIGPVGHVVRDQAIEVLLVQESGSRRRLRAVGAALGMAVATDPVAFPRRRIKDAVLVRPPRRLGAHRLLRFDGGSLLYPRGALIARLDDLTAVSTHLGLNRAERAGHAQQLLDALRGIEGPLVLGGDLNAHPSDPAVQRIAGSYPEIWAAIGEGEGLTMPGDGPTARIDYLFAGGAVQALRSWTAPTTASDHLMVVADLALEA
jgi:endonuclease/exonuclease/phosphatase family metal-dependent hydrolase